MVTIIKNRILIPLIDWVVTLVSTVLGIRILLVFLGARQSAPFARWIFDTSNTLLQPFKGMFNSEVISRGFTLDFTAIFAAIVYAIVGYLLQELLWTLSAKSKKRK